MTALIRAGFVVEAIANWSRWIAACGRCPNAVKLPPHTPIFECGFCGAVTEVLWPSIKMVKAVERLLSMRPDPSTRNWVPGETLHQLMFENGQHGIFDEAPDTGGMLFSVTDEEIRVDTLPALTTRVRKTIGA